MVKCRFRNDQTACALEGNWEMKKSLLVIASFVFLTACSGYAPTATVTPTATPSPTETPTLTHTPTLTPSPTPSLPPEFLAQFDGTEFAAAGGGLTYTPAGGEAISVPGEFNAAGFTATLDSGRGIDIPQEQLTAMFKVDANYDLLKVYDENGVISAEYDYGQNMWIDIQKLATSIDCPSVVGCFYYARNTPADTTAIESASTGIIRTVDLKDKIGNSIGNLLVIQMVSRASDDRPIVFEVAIQGELASNPGVNILPGVYQSILHEPSDLTNGRLLSIDEWNSIMERNSKWEIGSSNNGDPFYTVLKNTYLDLPENEALVASFIANKGRVNFDSFNLILNIRFHHKH